MHPKELHQPRWGALLEFFHGQFLVVVDVPRWNLKKAEQKKHDKTIEMMRELCSPIISAYLTQKVQGHMVKLQFSVICS